ncbi:MAG: type III pantothenate kinase, partial [candidate division WOR-3 bacterium]
MMASALSKGTAQLPKVRPRFPNKVLATNTTDGICVGVSHALFAGITQIIRTAEQETGRKFKVVATGGLATRFARFIHNVSAVEPWLTLQGLAAAYYYSRRRND